MPPAAASSRSPRVVQPLVLTDERVYEVRKKVSDFPEREDLSTAEAAYATIHRAYAAEGDAVWRRFSVPELAKEVPASAKKPSPKEEAERFLNAEILEVHLWNKDCSGVIARMPRKGHGFDMRSLRCVKGNWLNDGDDFADSIEEARNKIATWRAYQKAKYVRDHRPPVADPASHLKPFVDFLHRQAKDPERFILDAIGKHRLVILGEIHNRPRYWAFNCDLVRSSEFALRTGVIYLELPSNDQPLVDRFLAAARYDPGPIIEMLRDMHEAGSPCQATLDFFRTVWEVNQKLPEPQRLRIVLADIARPWKEIHKREDWKKYYVDRDQFMAESIVRDLRRYDADKRHALFIVGYGHAMVNFTQPGGEPIKSAGWHLRERVGEAGVFAVFPHGPVITDRGQVGGRLALGLFDTAFAALGNKPTAFALDRGPFGKQLFDADQESPTVDPYSKGYHAYLYLGPVEGETLSPLIPGFYTDEFVREVDRRWRIMFGKGLAESVHAERLDGGSYAAYRGQFWGQPRREWSADQLGPVDAWQCGSRFRDRQPDAEQVAKHYMASLEALRNKALRIKSKAVRSSSPEDLTISQILLLHGGNVRLEDSWARGGRVSPRSETSIAKGQYLMAILEDVRPGVLLTGFVHTPADRFNRVVSRLNGADFLGFPLSLLRGKSCDILHVLPKLKLAARRETTDGTETVLLEGTSEDVALKLWIAPSLNYCPARIEWRPTVPELTKKNIDRIPAFSLHACEFREFEKAGDSYVPRSLRVHSLTPPCYVRDGEVHPRKTVENRFDVTWSVEILSPPRVDDFKLTMDIPEGTRVHMEDARHLQFVWHNGKAVPVVDE